eukprot:NODE_26_length_40862_cov_0.679513.p7 type:complete len:696 gc:universal NODE_26_length_40862_cov_0.679513:31006-28919(-)
MKSMNDLNKNGQDPDANNHKDDERLRSQTFDPAKNRYPPRPNDFPDYYSDYSGTNYQQMFPPRMPMYDMYGYPVPPMYYYDYPQMSSEEYYRMRNMRYEYPPEMDPRFARDDPRLRMDFDNRLPYDESRFSGNSEGRFNSENRYSTIGSDSRFSKDGKELSRDPRFANLPQARPYPQDPRYSSFVPPGNDPRALRDPYSPSEPRTDPRVAREFQIGDPRNDPRYQDPRNREDGRTDTRIVREQFGPNDPRNREPQFPLNDPRFARDQYGSADPRNNFYDSYRRDPYSGGHFRENYEHPQFDAYKKADPYYSSYVQAERTSSERLNNARSSYYEINPRRETIPPPIEIEQKQYNYPRKQSETSDDSQVFEGQKDRVANKGSVRRSQSVKQPQAGDKQSLSIQQQEQLERIQKIAFSKEETAKLEKDVRKDKEQPQHGSAHNLKFTDTKEKFADLKLEPKNSTGKSNKLKLDNLNDRPKSISFADSSVSDESDIKKSSVKKAAENYEMKKSPSKGDTSKKSKPFPDEIKKDEKKIPKLESSESASKLRPKDKIKDENHASTSLNSIDKQLQDKVSPKKSRLSTEIEPEKIDKELASIKRLSEVLDDPDMISGSRALSTISASIDIDPNDGRIKQSQMINPEISVAFFEKGIEPEILDASTDDFSAFNSLQRVPDPKNERNLSDKSLKINKRPSSTMM